MAEATRVSMVAVRWRSATAAPRRNGDPHPNSTAAPTTRAAASPPRPVRSDPAPTSARASGQATAARTNQARPGCPASAAGAATASGTTTDAS